MKTLYILFLLVSFNSFSQNNEPLPGKFTALKTDTISIKNKFEKDVKNNKIIIYLHGGIVSAIKKTDLDFQEKYGITYKDFGCVMPENSYFYKKYNELAVKYLTEKYGNDFKTGVNKHTF